MRPRRIGGQPLVTRKAAARWLEQGNQERAELERRKLEIERAALQLERDRAEVEERSATEGEN